MHPGKLQRTALVAVTVILMLAATALLAGVTFHSPFDHDENGYVASGVLLVRQGALPYLDYPYFETPYLSVVYALITETTAYVFLAARASSVVFAILLVVVIFLWSQECFSRELPILRVAASLAAAWMVFSNPFFLDATTKAWNYNLSILLGLVSAVLIAPTAGPYRSKGRVFLSGLFLGLATGSRLTFALALVPLLGLSLFLAKDKSVLGRLAQAGIALAGFAVALLPLAVLAALAARQFLWDNLTFRSLDTLYQFQNGGWAVVMTRHVKLRYLVTAIFGDPRNVLLFLGLAGAAVLVLWNEWRSRRRISRGLWTAVAFLPFLVLGALLPNPLWYEYFFTFMPTAAMGLVAGLAALSSSRCMRWAVFAFLTAASILGVVGSFPQYRQASALLHPSSWVPVVYHEQGLAIAKAKAPGPILTLTPIFPLEGGVPIYPQLVTGPFAWRVGDFASPSTRRKIGLVSPADFEEVIRQDPPGGILVGGETTLEAPLVQYAKTHSYRPTDLGDGLTLWIPP
ncbi:MAG: hypothetical protein ABSG98_00990 [Anaerolineales bacterium]|jgi:4-amino-4-deoxy-L-arabinose transferase-like glycosyltransferase